MDSSDHNIIISNEEYQVGHESNVAATPTTQTSCKTREISISGIRAKS